MDYQKYEEKVDKTNQITHTGQAVTDTPPPSTPAVMLPDIEEERAEMRRQLAEANARAEREAARAERAEEEKSRISKSATHVARKGKTITTKLPTERHAALATVRGLPILDALGKLGKRAVQHTGLMDFGPPPDGFRGIPATGSCSSPDLYIEYYLGRYGVAKTAKRLADKMHERIFKIRQHLVEEVEMMIFLVLLDRHAGDEKAALREFISMDRLPVYALDINDADASEPAVVHAG